MTLESMHTRILIGVGAWLLGAAAATGGSLLAVSLLGQGIAGGTGQQQLTSEAVNRALASEGNDPGPASPGQIAAAAPTRSAQPTASPSPGPTGGTVLTSPGGTVVAGCASAGVYLMSWSPQQGYEVNNVVRGPGSSARVGFWSPSLSVTMVVSCAGGAPSATTYLHRSGDD